MSDDKTQELLQQLLVKSEPLDAKLTKINKVSNIRQLRQRKTL